PEREPGRRVRRLQAGRPLVLAYGRLPVARLLVGERELPDGVDGERVQRDRVPRPCGPRARVAGERRRLGILHPLRREPGCEKRVGAAEEAGDGPGGEERPQPEARPRTLPRRPSAAEPAGEAAEEEDGAADGD